MPELRKDPLVPRWVVMAPERANRPTDVVVAPAISEPAFDPFAEGNEESTTPEIIGYRNTGSAPNEPGWRVRVIPNKFPALHMTGNLDVRRDGIYEVMDGVGAHEVIVECPHYETSMAHLSVSNIQEVLWIYRERLIQLKRDPRFVHAVVFKNKGVRAGASLQHSHSQLIATPVVPVAIWEEIAGAMQFYQTHGRSLFNDMIKQERQAGVRVVLETAEFLVICPFASRFAYETWILPKQHSSHYETITPACAQDLAVVLKSILRKLELALDDPPYNYVIHSAPFNEPELPYFVWHIEIFPRLTRVAGFEWGSGCYINEVLPETAAAILRDIKSE